MYQMQVPLRRENKIMLQKLNKSHLAFAMCNTDQNKNINRCTKPHITIISSWPSTPGANSTSALQPTSCWRMQPIAALAGFICRGISRAQCVCRQTG